MSDLRLFYPQRFTADAGGGGGHQGARRSRR